MWGPDIVKNDLGKVESGQYWSNLSCTSCTKVTILNDYKSLSGVLQIFRYKIKSKLGYF